MLVFQKIPAASFVMCAWVPKTFFRTAEGKANTLLLVKIKCSENAFRVNSTIPTASSANASLSRGARA